MMLTRCHQYGHVSHTVGDASSLLVRLRLLWAERFRTSGLCRVNSATHDFPAIRHYEDEGRMIGNRQVEAATGDLSDA